MKEQSDVASCGGKGIPSSPLGTDGGKVERWVHSCLQRAVLGAGETAVITTKIPALVLLTFWSRVGKWCQCRAIVTI